MIDPTSEERRMTATRRALFVMVIGVSLTSWAFAQSPKPRARDLGVPFEGTPGPLNAITDITGIEVGETTIIEGTGEHAARTGVTIIWPKGKKWEPVFAGLGLRRAIIPSAAQPSGRLASRGRPG
jgi:hypothetical protein